MKILFDFLPIVIFFIGYKLSDIYLATGAAILASLALVIFARLQKGHFEKMSLFTLITLTLLGGATLLFRNELFIKWKPTAIYWALALAFLMSHFVGQKPLFQRMTEEVIMLPRLIWYRLNLSWAGFFTVMGALNLYVVYHFDTPTWVHFKLFGTLGITLVFAILQGLYMMKHSLPSEDSSLAQKEKP